MRPGLESISALCSSLGDPQRRFKAIHVAGTNGKGAVSAFLASALKAAGNGGVGMYTSPHLVKINERFIINGGPVPDEKLDEIARIVHSKIEPSPPNSWGQAPSNSWGQAPKNGGLSPGEVTFFEALTAISYSLFAEAGLEFVILECGLGGRLDATNVCCPELCVITKVGLDHCDWLGSSVEEIAGEKAGIVKPGVPVVLGRNDVRVRAVVSARAASVGAPFFYAPDLADESELPRVLVPSGSFNRDNAVTALAALRVLARQGRIPDPDPDRCFVGTYWPGRFHRVGDFIVDGAHNPPAASALAEALRAEFSGVKVPLIAGFCADKDADVVLRTLSPHISRAFAVKTSNPRSLSAEETAELMRTAGMDAVACGSLDEAMSASRAEACEGEQTLICGSLFLAGEALVALGEPPWGSPPGIDPSELLRP